MANSMAKRKDPRLRFTPSEVFRAHVRTLAEATGRTEDDLTREAAELGLPVLRKKLEDAVSKLRRTAGGRT